MAGSIRREVPVFTAGPPASRRPRSRHRLRGEIEFQDRHLELIGDLAILVIAVDHADEFVGNIDLGRVLRLRPRADLDGVVLEGLAKICLELHEFVTVHDRPAG
jgi:hypothetical protein